MEAVYKYYSYSNIPNDEELEACCSIATKGKGTVILYFDDHVTSVKYIFVHPRDTLADVKFRLKLILNGDTICEN